MSAFEKIFSVLKKMGEMVPAAKITYQHLQLLNNETTEEETMKLAEALNSIKYGSNTNSYFYFYFPIVSHILYYKPNLEKGILKYLIRPNFANGTTDTREMIELIISAMNFTSKDNEHYVTAEAKEWTEIELPKLEREVERD